MSVYKVINKHHIRAKMVELAAVDNRGNPYVITNMGVPVRFEVGDLIDDLTPAEMEAFPDRFELVSGEALTLPEARGLLTPAPRLNPELYSLVARAHAGSATADEQALVGDVLAYMEHYAQGRATSEETAALELKLADFDMPLFV